MRRARIGQSASKDISGAGSLVLAVIAGAASALTIRSGMWLFSAGHTFFGATACGLAALLAIFTLVALFGVVEASFRELRREHHARKWDVKRR